MTKEDIIKLAREAGLQPYYDEQESDITAFAHLVAAAEREECAAMFDDRNVWDEEVGERIRARGNT